MSGKAETIQRVRSRDFDAIEDEWLERLDSDPTETTYFVEVAGVLADSDQIETARPLLRLLDEELAERGALRERLDLLLAVGQLFLRPGTIHETVVEILQEIYSHSASLPDMFRVAGLHQQPADLRVLRRQADRLHSLMLLDVGSLVSMEGKGVGTITEINFDLGRYKVDFERIKALTVGFKAGAKLLEPLPEKHVLRYKIEAPERLATLRDDEPSELLREVLESYDEPRTAAQIKADLEGIVTPGQWSRWWTAARKHPQALVTSDKRHRYHWAESSDDATAALRAAFAQADLDGQLEIFSKNAKQNPEFAAAMAETLEAAARRSLDGNPTQALTVWYVLSRAGMADNDIDFAPATVVRQSDDVTVLAGGLSPRALREIVFDQVQSQRSDWIEILSTCVLSEPDAGLAGKLMGKVAADDRERYERLVDTVLNRPHESPGAFVWLAKSADDDDDLRRSRALRLFRQLLRTASRDQFTPYRAALAPLLQSGGTLPKLVMELAEDDAQTALDEVKRSSLEDYAKTPLVAALEMRFSSLRERPEDGLYALRQSIDARREETRKLKEEEIPANRQAIQEAVALGDLRENFEYKSARQRHEYLSARLAGLQVDLERVQPIDLEGLRDDEVRIGSSVDLEADGERRQITILGPWESDPEAGVLSYQSDLGQALLGAKPGESVQLENRSFRVLAIGTHGE